MSEDVFGAVAIGWLLPNIILQNGMRDFILHGSRIRNSIASKALA